jgi:hypothetical protein
MRVRPLAVQLVPFFVQDHHCVELVGPDIVQPNVDSQVERRAQVEGAPDEQAGFGGLRGIELVLRAVIATTATGGVRTQAGIAQIVAPERPVDQVSQGGLLRPLPG